MAPARVRILFLLAPILAIASCGGDAEEPLVLSPLAQEGRDLASQFGCTNCHSTSGGGAGAPSWKDLAGSEVSLKDGRTVVADDEYLRLAIVDPQAEVVKGYPGSMPPYGDRIAPEQLDALVAYLRELSVHTAPSASVPSSGG